VLARGNLQSKLTISTQFASFPAEYLPISFRAPLAGAVVFMGIVLVDFGVAKYQEMQVRARGARIAKLAEIALSSLQGDIQSVADLGDGHYQLAVYLLNAAVALMPACTVRRRCGSEVGPAVRIRLAPA
jgi:hypothetical protein